MYHSEVAKITENKKNNERTDVRAIVTNSVIDVVPISGMCPQWLAATTTQIK